METRERGRNWWLMSYDVTTMHWRCHVVGVGLAPGGKSGVHCIFLDARIRRCIL